MKFVLIFFISIILVSSCHPKIQETDTISERGADSIYAAYLHMARTLPDSLGKIGPYIATERDTNVTFAVLDSPFLAIGKLIDSTSIFAVSCVNTGNYSARLRVYRYDHDKCTMVGFYNVEPDVISLKFMNMDSDKSTNEIVLLGSNNVNLNREIMVYKYNPHRGIVYSGNFFTTDEELNIESENGGYKVDAAHNTICVDYEGNNAGVSRSLYLWREDSLVLLRSSYIDNATGRRILSYNINKDTCFSCGLTEVFSENDNYNNTVRYKKYWEHFFDLK